MPIHDWTRVDGGTYHDFHQVWTIEIRNALNRGILPAGYTAVIEPCAKGGRPDHVIGPPVRPVPGLLSAIDYPPRVRQIDRAETAPAAYARRANRIGVRYEFGPTSAVIEVISPGNKGCPSSIRPFIDDAVELLDRGVSLVIIDLFPPTPRDPDGLHQLIWEEMTDDPFAQRPADKPLTIASYDPGDGLTAYVNPVAVGDPLPDTPHFFAPGWYVNIPLERTYAAAWAETPQNVRDEVTPPPTV